jgi:hypothetical protein
MGATSADRRRLIYPALAALIAVLSYQQYLWMRMAEFDTVAKIVTYHGGLEDLPRILTQPEQQYMLTTINYRPVASLILWAMHALFGLNLTPYHWLLILLHAANAVLVFALARRLIGDGGFYSFLAAAFFAAHPIHLQTVIFVSRLPDMLVAFYGMVAVLAFIQGGTGYRRISVLACALAVFSKTTGSITPAIIFAYLLTHSEGGWKERVKAALRQSLPYWAPVALFIPLMFYSLGRMDGYYAIPDSPWHFNPLNYVFSLTYPTDFLGLNPFSYLYFKLSEPLPGALFIACGIAALAVSLKLASRDESALFLLLWFLGFLAVYMSAYVLISPWHMYAPLVPYSILAAIILKKGFHGHGIQAKAGFLAVAAVMASVTAYSPLVSDYPAPRIASDMIRVLSDETVYEARYLPPGSRIYLLNYPEYMVLVGKGSPYSLFIVSEGSMQALLDYNLPGRGIRSYSLTAAKVYSTGGKIVVGMYPQGNCVVSAENLAQNSSDLYPASQWLLNDTGGREELSFRMDSNKDGQWITITFPERDWTDTYLFVYDGQHVNVRELSKICS